MKSETKIERLALDDLLDDPNNPGNVIDDEADTALTASIALHDIQVPLICFPTPKGLMLADGHRRKRCGKAAGKVSAPCIVWATRPDPPELLTMQLTWGTHRRGLNAIEEFEAFQRLASLRNWSASQLAENLAISPAEVTRVMSMGKLTAEERQLVREGKISKSSAYALARMPAEGREALARKAAAGELTRNELDAKARQRPKESTQGNRRVCCHVPKGTVTVINSDGLSLSSVIELLEGLLRKCRKLRTQKHDLVSAAKVMKAEATAAGEVDAGGRLMEAG